MTGDTSAERRPRSATDEERLTARRAVSPRNALIEHLSLLEGGVPGSAAVQAGRWLRWSVDHAAAMQLWEPSDGVGLPPREMEDAFL